LPAPALSPAAIALNRFGLGARPGDPPPADPRRWLTDQFGAFTVRPAGFAALPEAAPVLRAYQAQRRAIRQVRTAPSPAPAPAMTPTMTPEPQAGAAVSGRGMLREARDGLRELYRAAVEARMNSALATEAPFVERLVHFWANHFAISAENQRVTAYAGAFERDAIRPHVLGRFEDMLLAVERHPAMLIYLNQANSIGPDSPAGLRLAANGRERGLNENLAREILELHTLGVRTGYTQADVTEFARALTGWTVEEPETGQGAGFAFRPGRHQPGPRSIVGRRYDQPGEAQARAALIDFAAHPATAAHVATKLARHFAGDEPPKALVERLAATFTRTRGDLPSVYAALVASPEVWAPAPVKFKSPWEWTVSALRGLGRTGVGPMPVFAMLQQLGQPVWRPGSPAGWDDLASTWAAPDALMRRVEVAARLAAPLGDKLDARALGPRLFPASLSAATADQLGRAESPSGALALLLASPDFLRR
jgi:uncharacterized protein (DUF1800 family)